MDISILSLFSFATLIGDGILVFILAVFLWEFLSKKQISLGRFIYAILYKYGTYISFIIALVATLGSLFYSEIIGLEPCKLCWLQRIFMFPLSIYFSLALALKKKAIQYFALAMAIPGSALSLFHYFLQRKIIDNPYVACSNTEQLVSCSDHYIMNYGYITIPVMTMTAFGFIILVMTIQLLKKKI